MSHQQEHWQGWVCVRSEGAPKYLKGREREGKEIVREWNDKKEEKRESK